MKPRLHPFLQKLNVRFQDHVDNSSKCLKGFVVGFFLRIVGSYIQDKPGTNAQLSQNIQPLITEKATHYNNNHGNLYFEHGHLSIQLLFCNVEQ